MACFCLMTEHDFQMMEMMNRASAHAEPAFGDVHYLNQTAQGVLARIEGATPQDSASVAHALKAWFPQTQLFDQTPHSHHIIPQQFEQECKALGINVDDYTVLLDPKSHSGLHAEGYNTAWGDLMGECQNLDRTSAYQAVQQFARQMVEVFGWGTGGIQYHRTHLK